MLSRTANELYWMARHIERAENTARLLDVTYRTSLMPYQVRAACSRAARQSPQPLRRPRKMRMCPQVAAVPSFVS